MINKEIINKNNNVLVNEEEFKNISKYIEKIEIENKFLKNELEVIKNEKNEINKKMNFKLVKYAYKLTILKRRFFL